MAKARPEKSVDSGQTFESSLKKLEAIVDQLEQGDVPLEDSIRMYEEGITLSKACVEKLMKAEMRIKTLSKDMDGNFRVIGEDTE